MFEQKLTERAKHAINLAGQSAAEMGHNYIGTEHILLGLVREGSGVAAKVLADNNITDSKIISKIEFFVGTDLPLNSTAIGFTPRTKSVLEHSYSEARRFNHNYIGTEHILIALLREAESLAMRILTDLDINPQKLFTDIINLMKENNFGEISDEGPAPDASKNMPKKHKSEKTPTLDKFGRDLTALAAELKLDP